MECQRCKSDRILHVCGHCSDLCFVSMGDLEHDGYVPCDCGIGGGDDIDIYVCLACGQIQGSWPKPTPKELLSITQEESDADQERT